MQKTVNGDLLIDGSLVVTGNLRVERNVWVVGDVNFLSGATMEGYVNAHEFRSIPKYITDFSRPNTFINRLIFLFTGK